MSTYDDANLIMFPSGFKAAKLYSQKPIDGVGDFTAARNSVATRFNSDGLIEEVAIDVPRLDYLNVSCPNLLLEDQSTNLLTHSEDFSNASWIKSDISVALNQEVSPDGTVNASHITADAAAGTTPRIHMVFTSVASQPYMATFFAKKSTLSWVRILSTGATAATLDAFYDIKNGVLGTSGTPSKASIEDYGNGWFRLSLLIDAVNSTGAATIRFQITTDDGVATFSPIGTEKVAIWGAQLENMLSSTSYIKTVASTVTRLKDEITDAGDSTTFNSEEGVLFIEVAGQDNKLTDNGWISISDGTTNNRIMIGLPVGSSFRMFVAVGGVIQADDTHDVADRTDFHKVALKYKDNDFSLWVDGAEVLTDSSGSVPAISTLTKLSFHNATGASNLFGETNQVLVFRTALTDLELQTLTT